jgi:hypothetical protein
MKLSGKHVNDVNLFGEGDTQFDTSTKVEINGEKIMHMFLSIHQNAV